MKISIAWVFNHIDADWQAYSIEEIVRLFNEKVAEIEGYYKVEVPLDHLFLAQVKQIEAEHVQLFIPETSETVELPKRDDLQNDHYYIIKKHDTKVVWATGLDFGGQKDLLPSLWCAEDLIHGEWKETIDATDWIIEVDNKSITHRPDMWGHRGFAREIALLLGLKLNPIEACIKHLPVETYTNEVEATDTMPFSARIAQTDKIDRFAFAYFSHIENRPSSPWMAADIIKVDTRPIDFIVDTTNYVMLDLGQPLHAFDAEKISSRYIEPRLAQAGESLQLLDGETIELTHEDIVISDGQKPIALAGIMGGKETEVDEKTKSVVLESAHFDATTVRETAARHKKRTEASARFEKTLDPNQNVLAIERFVTIIENAGLPFTLAGTVSIGHKSEPLRVEILHSYIEDRLGTQIKPEQVAYILRSLDCEVDAVEQTNDLLYKVMIPTCRCTKDMRIKEDIVEEVARIFGYTNIPFVLPSMQSSPSNLDPIMRLRHVKRLLAFGYQMREVYNYAFYDEEFLRQLDWQPTNFAFVQSPVSENWQKLTTSLIPGLLKNIWQNHVDHPTLRFFEVGRIWHKDDAGYSEASQLAGIIYDQKKPTSFYELKNIIEDMAHMLDMSLTYEKVDDPAEPWFAPYQTARIKHNGLVIGTIGVINIGFTHAVFPGYAAAFTFDAAYVQAFKATEKQFKHLAKYPGIARDISMMVPLSITVAQVTEAIQSASCHISQVALVDVFKKDEWQNEKSLTFSFLMQDETKTLKTAEADAMYEQVVKAVEKLGAQIR